MLEVPSHTIICLCYCFMHKRVNSRITLKKLDNKINQTQRRNSLLFCGQFRNTGSLQNQRHYDVILIAG